MIHTRSHLRRTTASLLVCVNLLFLLLATPAHAEEVLKEISVQQLMSIMNSEGYSVTISSDGLLIVWRIDNDKAILSIPRTKSAIVFSAGSDDLSTLEKVNAFNRSSVFSRAFLTDDGNPRLRLDFDLTGGVTDANIHNFLRICRISFTRWRKAVL
jgi:hypothetical protein